MACQSTWLQLLALLAVAAELQICECASALECSGDSQIPANSTLCFGGSELGLNLMVNFRTTGTGTGTVDIVVSWKLLEAKCPAVPFNSTKEVLTLDQEVLQDCLPGFLGVGMVAYCSDQNQLLLRLESPLPITVTLPEGKCGETSTLSAPAHVDGLALETSTHHLSAHQTVLPRSGVVSAWACTGDDPMPTYSTLCFAGSKFGVKLSAVLRTAGQGMGTANITTSWKRGDDQCTEVPFNVSGQVVTLNPELVENCLPRSVSLGTVTYCSDQSKLLLQLVTFLPITMTLTEVQCQRIAHVSASSSRGATGSARGDSLATSDQLPVHDAQAQRSDSAPVWDCTGETPMPANSTLCFGGSAFGVNLRAVFQTTGEGLGTVNISLSWKRIEANCPVVPFTSSKWMLNLDQVVMAVCLPDFVSLGMLAYCSDQRHILVQLETPFPMIITLAEVPCSEEDDEDDDSEQEEEDEEDNGKDNGNDNGDDSEQEDDDEDDDSEQKEEDAGEEKEDNGKEEETQTVAGGAAATAPSQQDASIAKKPDLMLP